MAVRDLIPWGRSRSSAPSPMSRDEFSPFLTLHREMNRLFDDVFSRSESVPSWFGRTAWPSIEVTASDRDVRVSAELPGMDENDVEVLVDNDVLTIRGEKRSETEDNEHRMSERYYGRFERRIALPFEVEDGEAKATFKNGVLTVTLPKSAKAQEKAKRIAINSATESRH
jgi:HSP20 family protein